MPSIIDGPPGPDDAPGPFLRRLGWFLLIAAGGAMITAVAAYGLEVLLPR
jgi:hypothetical protein